ncbi:threonine--tRNA ligase [bacterium]|nr:threonine--tRNA ligase [bacterium]
MEKDAISKKRHSLAHVLAMAVLEKDPNAKLAIGPAIDTGFYYDFELSSPLSADDLPALETRMKELLKEGLSFEGREVSPDEAQELFKQSPYKLDLIEEFTNEGKTLTAYSSGDFTDLCAGGHVDTTKDIDPDSFSLDKLAGAYWRGDENNQMLTRIYGLAFETKKELEEYKKQQEEAEKRDHRKLGKELDLFAFSPLVGPGLPLFTPKGSLLRDLLDDFVWELRQKDGYDRVDIPHITKIDLFKTSGHWDKFGDELFQVKTREDHVFALKPMNCPHHTQIYARKNHSYRELPVRYANTTKCYRDEQTGELSGLSRVRAFTQDDAHVFCRTNQVEEEVGKVWDIVTGFYNGVGYSDLQVTLSAHDPNNMEKYLGDKALWEQAEGILGKIIEEKTGKKAEKIEGEAAFYGPKIDFITKDSIGREWQIATIQLDMNLPERFDLTCTNEKGEKERIVMIHAAIMGSIERFLSVYIEHTGGVFPLFLSPVQVAILPIADSHKEYAEEVRKTLEENGVRVEQRSEDETLGKKIRSVKEQKIPYFIVIGDKEVESKSVKLESRSGDGEEMNTEELLSKLKKEIDDKA